MIVSISSSLVHFSNLKTDEASFWPWIGGWLKKAQQIFAAYFWIPNLHKPAFESFPFNEKLKGGVSIIFKGLEECFQH